MLKFKCGQPKKTGRYEVIMKNKKKYIVSFFEQGHIKICSFPDECRGMSMDDIECHRRIEE